MKRKTIAPEYDKLQWKLTATGIEPNTNRFAEIPLNDKLKDKNIMCPFCLHTYKISDFNLNRGLYVCPTCANQMKPSTIEKMASLKSTEELAIWVYDYKLNGFWTKINQHLPKNERFNAWNNQLKALTISYDFWTKYKQLKGIDEPEQETEPPKPQWLHPEKNPLFNQCSTCQGTGYYIVISNLYNTRFERKPCMSCQTKGIIRPSEINQHLPIPLMYQIQQQQVVKPYYEHLEI